MNADLFASGCLLQSSPDHFVLGWGAGRRAARPELERLSIYAPDFHLDSAEPWLIFSDWKRVDRHELLKAILALDASAQPSRDTPHWERPDPSHFRASFDELQALIGAGELKKAVPVVFSHSRFKMDPARLARMLLRALDLTGNQPLSLYGLWQDGAGILGATPELLFELDGNRVETMALAGTRPHGSDQAPLLEDPKELNEHRWVVTGIERALSSLGKVTIGETRELRLASFSHLLTPITLEFNGALEFEAVVRAMHPTPALGAFPRERGSQWLRAQAWSKSRQRFGAPFGALWKFEGQIKAVCRVAIRNIQWEESGDVILGAGVGVVAESSFDREWRELEAKTRSVQAVFGL